jgi:hypothetical protein
VTFTQEMARGRAGQVAQGEVMTTSPSGPTRPWFAIGWFLAWGLFQAFAVVSVLNGTWERPEAFPAGVYEALIWPDMLFVPLYVSTAALLWTRHWLGGVLAFAAGGGIVYAMLYLLALSRLSGAVNVVADGLFLAITLAALWQVGTRVRHRAAG